MNGVAYAVRAEEAGLKNFIVALVVIGNDEKGTQCLGL
jgi:hypothetical protein